MDQNSTPPMFFINRDGDLIQMYVDSEVEDYVRHVKRLPTDAAFDEDLRTRTERIEGHLVSLVMALRHWPQDYAARSRQPLFDHRSYIFVLYNTVRQSIPQAVPPLPADHRTDSIIDLTTPPEDARVIWDGHHPSQAERTWMSVPRTVGPRLTPTLMLPLRDDQEATTSTSQLRDDANRPEQPRRWEVRETPYGANRVLIPVTEFSQRTTPTPVLTIVNDLETTRDTRRSATQEEPTAGATGRSGNDDDTQEFSQTMDDEMTYAGPTTPPNTGDVRRVVCMNDEEPTDEEYEDDEDDGRDAKRRRIDHSP